MTTYQVQVTLPDEFRMYFEPFAGQGTVRLSPDAREFTFEFEAGDLWDAHELVSEAANEADAQAGRIGGWTKFARAVEVAEPDDTESIGAKFRKHFEGKPLLDPEFAAEPKPDYMLNEVDADYEAMNTPLTGVPEPTLLNDPDEELGSDPDWREHGATLLVGSDRYPYTVMDAEYFKTGKRAGQVRAVLATLDDFRAPDTFIVRSDREAERFIATAVEGRFRSAKHAGSYLHLGERLFYQAPEV
jgi:hypothetical protein